MSNQMTENANALVIYQDSALSLTKYLDDETLEVLQQPLPISLEPTADQLDDIAAKLRTIETAGERGTLAKTLAVGKMVLASIYGDDPAQFASKGSRHKPLDELAGRLGGEMSRSSLYNAVNVAVQYRDLPEQARDQLSLSHHVALTRVRGGKDPDRVTRRKQALAQQAVDEKLSVRDFEAACRQARDELRGPRARIGSSTSDVIRQIQVLEKTADNVTGALGQPETYRTLTVENLEQIEDFIGNFVGKAQEVRDLVQDRITRLNSMTMVDAEGSDTVPEAEIPDASETDDEDAGPETVDPN